MSDKMDMATTIAQYPDSAKSIVVAAFLGGLLSMNFVKDLTWKQRLIAIVSGMIVAHYVTPLIAFLLKEGDYAETIGFLIGLFGMSICAAIFRAIENSDIWGLINRRFSRGEEQ